MATTKRIILFNATSTEKRAALLENGKLVELVVERPDQYRILGNIYRGRVTAILPGIQSAFIDVGLEQAAFLHVSDVDPTLLLDVADNRIERYTDRGARSKRKHFVKVPIEEVLEKGQDVLVQILKEPIGNKSPKVTTQLSLAGRFLVLVPDSDFIGISKKTSDRIEKKRLKQIISRYKPEGVGFIVRTIGLKVTEQDLIHEMKSLIDQWRKAQRQALSGKGPKRILKECSITTQVIRDLFSEDVAEVHVDSKEDYNEILAYLKTGSSELCKRVKLYNKHLPLFDKFGIEHDVEKSLKRKVWIRHGGYLYFDHAEALLAIDVNTGRNVGKKDLEETIFETNMEAAREICRQLRLRDIGGLIVVDFIDMKKTENKRRLEREMRSLLTKDSTAVSCTGLSKFGLMEITRKRVRPGLQELFTDVCHSCNGLGRVFNPATVTGRIDRFLSRTNLRQESKNLILSVSPSVASFIQKDNNHILMELNKSHKLSLTIQINENLDQDEFELYDQRSNQAITDKYSS